MEGYKLGKTSIKVPSGWHEINFNKAMDILDGELNAVETLAVLTDKTPEEIRKATDLDTIFYFTNTFLYLQQLPGHDFPRSIQMGPDLVKFPAPIDLGNAEVGQVEDMQSIIMKMNKDFTGETARELTELELIKIMPHIAAVYIQKLLDGEYDGQTAQDMVPRIKEEVSFKAITGIGYFFLSRLTALMSGQESEWRRYHLMQRSWKQVLINSMRRLAHTLHLTR